MTSDSFMTSFGPTYLVGYSFGYDGANRLTTAKFAAFAPSPYPNWQTATPYGMPSMTYDSNGNLTSLQRYGSSTSLIDNLGYTYASNTNRISSISNSAPGGASSSYTYDSNGNVISDSKDGIAFAVYDPFNEPVEVCLTNGTVYTYGGVYPALGGNVDGTRILKNWGGSNWNFYMNDPDGKTIAINLGPTSSSVDYNVWAGNDNIGQVRYNGSYSYYYYLKDHLGNVKMTLSSTGSIYTWNDYYPFGESMPGRNVFEAGPDTRYQYTSKERDTETGLDYFGARYYDSWSGRWYSVDPMSGKYPTLSPYTYTADNPVTLIDPHGDTISTFGLTNEQLKQWNAEVAAGMKSKDFAKVYSELQSSTAKYSVVIGKAVKENAGGDFKPNAEGKLHTGGIVTLTPGAVRSLVSISHELYHAYQNDLGPYVHGSTGLELEAFLFQQKVQSQLSGFLTTYTSGSPFDAAFESLLTNGFTVQAWDQGMKYFNESSFNSGHLYDKLKYIEYSDPLIKSFLH